MEDQKRKIASIVSSNDEEAFKIDQIAKVRGWFRPEDNSIYYPTVQKYIEGGIDIGAATSALFDSIDKNIADQKLDDVNFPDLWYSIIHAARRKPFHQAEEGGKRNNHSHAKATDLIAAFRDHNIPGNEAYNYIYSSLTDFSMACREVYNDTPDPDAGDLEIDAWANVNFFYAHVTKEGLEDLSIFAIWSMRSALENDLQDDDEGSAAQKYNLYVPAAASWIFGMGHVLYTKDTDLTPKDRRQGNPAKGGELWKGKAAFSKERWNLWKERLAVVSKMEKVSDKTRYISKDSLEAMERAESFSDNVNSANVGL